MKAECRCGQVTLDIRHRPRVRLFCHCTICQKVNQAPMADVVFFPARDVVIDGEVDFRRFQYVPVSVRRGFCARCQQLIVERLGPQRLGMAIVPTARLAEPDVAPTAAGHLFYERRVADVDDDLPKLTGLVRSQAFATRALLPTLIG